jgi:Fe-S cluster biogenesis protein NfuA/nitrite reductase/ring-hydroxylating ferredoxin subunit
MEATAAVSPDPPEVLVERVQHLQARLDEAGDGPTRRLADELVSAVVQMYGAGLERILERLWAAGEAGERLVAEVAEDPLIATLLLIHGLHPVALEDRVHAALESVRPYMESHGGNVELLSLEGDVARLRLRGSCSDCSASAVTLELAIKQALEEHAPDLAGLEVEGVAAGPIGAAPPPSGAALPMAAGNGAGSGVELPVVQAGPAPGPPAAWHELSPADEPVRGALGAVVVAGAPLVIANVEGTLLAYRDACPGCAGPIHDGELVEGALRCPRCGTRFLLPRAGRSIDGSGLQLEPVPLLREQGRVKVALAR